MPKALQQMDVGRSAVKVGPGLGSSPASTYCRKAGERERRPVSKIATRRERPPEERPGESQFAQRCAAIGNSSKRIELWGIQATVEKIPTEYAFSERRVPLLFRCRGFHLPIPAAQERYRSSRALNSIIRQEEAPLRLSAAARASAA